MKQSRDWLLLVIMLLSVGGSLGCGREAPAEKTKAASGNAVTEAAGQALVEYAKTPMDKARQTEGVLEQSAEQRAAEIQRATPQGSNSEYLNQTISGGSAPVDGPVER